MIRVYFRRQNWRTGSPQARCCLSQTLGGGNCNNLNIYFRHPGLSRNVIKLCRTPCVQQRDSGLGRTAWSNGNEDGKSIRSDHENYTPLALSQTAVISARQACLLVDELIHADRRAGTMTLTKCTARRNASPMKGDQGAAGLSAAWLTLRLLCLGAY